MASFWQQACKTCNCSNHWACRCRCVRFKATTPWRPSRISTKPDQPHVKAISSLLKVANDYYPNAANFNTASFWSSTFALQPNGMPLTGATTHGNIFVNTGHGAHGWAAAVGSAKLLADAMAGRETEIDSDGLLLSALAS